MRISVWCHLTIFHLHTGPHISIQSLDNSLHSCGFWKIIWQVTETGVRKVMSRAINMNALGAVTDFAVTVLSKLTVLIWQLLWIELHQLKRVSQTPLLCFMSGDAWVNESVSDTHVWNMYKQLRYIFHIMQSYTTDRFHRPCRTPEWAPLEKDPSPLVSMDSAFPSHPSADNTCEQPVT